MIVYANIVCAYASVYIHTCILCGIQLKLWRMRNYSLYFPQVSLTFDLTPPSSGSAESIPQFTCTEFEGSLQPHGSRKIKILYAPGLVSSHRSVGYFTVKALGGLGECTVTCTGTPIGE